MFSYIVQHFEFLVAELALVLGYPEMIPQAVVEHLCIVLLVVVAELAGKAHRLARLILVHYGEVGLHNWLGLKQNILILKPVLRIRIRSDPDLFVGSGSGSGSDHKKSYNKK